MEQPQWRKSSYSGNQGACVEVARSDDTAWVRDSTRPAPTRLGFGAREWRGFLATVRRSEL